MSILDDNVLNRADDELAQSHYNNIHSFFYCFVYTLEYNVAFKEREIVHGMDGDGNYFDMPACSCDLKIYKYRGGKQRYSFYDIVRNGPRYDVILRDPSKPVLVSMNWDTMYFSESGKMLREGNIFPKGTIVDIECPYNGKITQITI